MPQESVWEKEYRHPQLVTKNDKPQKDVLRFLKFLRKNEGVELEGLAILDLGSGTGRNANYLAKLGNNVTGIEISKTAIGLARERAREDRVKVTYLQRSMGQSFPLNDTSVDLIFDVISSNSLNESEREMYLAECNRVLKPGGYMFVKALCKDGDKNAKALLKDHPGSEPDTYINQDMGLTERVFSRDDLSAVYKRYFSILLMKSKTNYSRFKGQSYKRNFWLVFLKKI
ncbi:class I SAM-dependent methyltransferase [Patescibacteria group bacterium]|nr:class I SAM-dependent methyltransferase [Patescibacteria group bacterium]MBU1029421.1 class I SAM-dependent methyltransferase [Patescibacteria group bacterium]